MEIYYSQFSGDWKSKIKVSEGTVLKQRKGLSLSRKSIFYYIFNIFLFLNNFYANHI